MNDESSINKVVYVHAHLTEFSSDYLGEVDSEALYDHLTEVVRELNEEHYQVVSVTPITSGRGSVGVGGFSYTSGLVVVAKQIAEI